MKSCFFAFSLFLCSLVISSSSQAQRIEPGPIQTFSGDATIVARILLNRAVKPCVEQLQDSVFEINMQEISYQYVSPKLNRYQFKGIALEGGDMVAGSALLNVEAKEMRGVFGNLVMSYSCNVVLPEPRR